MIVDWTACHPLLAERVQRMQAMYARRFAPELLVVTSLLRSVTQQVAYYAQGRQPLAQVNALRKSAGMGPLDEKANQRTVTNCDGIRTLSNHQGRMYKGKLVAMAADLAPTFDPDGPGPGKHVIPWEDEARFRRIGPIATEVGLAWGGDWKKPDLPHVELPGDVP